MRDEQVLVIVPTRRAADGSRVLGLPKGHLDAGETELQAATREVREEAGVEVELVAELGEVRYWYSRDGRASPRRVRLLPVPLRWRAIPPTTTTRSRRRAGCRSRRRSVSSPTRASARWSSRARADLRYAARSR